MKRIMLTIAYDGTAYKGWQIQPGEPTIEGVLNSELSRFLHEDIKVIGASRTDAGVHARGAIAVFDTESSIPGDKFSFAINKGLPDDIRIIGSVQVRDDFHPRKVPCRKTYEYRIYNDTFPMPTRRLYTYHVYGKLDERLMDRAGKHLIGEHDFTAFSSVGGQALTTVRTIFDVSVIREDREVIISVTGNGFLYNMVRIIAGTLIEVGQGKTEPDEIIRILEERDRSHAGQTAPACGLCLAGYTFDDDMIAAG